MKPPYRWPTTPGHVTGLFRPGGWSAVQGVKPPLRVTVGVLSQSQLVTSILLLVVLALERGAE